MRIWIAQPLPLGTGSLVGEAGREAQGSLSLKSVLGAVGTQRVLLLVPPEQGGTGGMMGRKGACPGGMMGRKV